MHPFSTLWKHQEQLGWGKRLNNKKNATLTHLYPMYSLKILENFKVGKQIGLGKRPIC